MTANADLVAFPGTAHASIDVVGGKAQSLIALCAAGHNVPPGFVVSSAFFAPWIAVLMDTPAWRAVVAGTPAERPLACEQLIALASAQPLSTTQRDTVAALQLQLSCVPQARFAVRSSATQEDLHGASFAGGYLTLLSVAAADLETAIRRCFASLFDQRVVAYKLARRIRLESLGMAVIVQEQLDSDVAGVGFSIDPLSNDFDHAVIDANWGLGETVVAGEVVPDHWVIDKHSRQVLAFSCGSKQKTRRLGPDRTVIDSAEVASGAACLSDAQVADVLALIVRIEREGGHPVDIEWAIADGELYVLQSRPVTAYVPLPTALQTAAGERRRLYLDVALSSGFTTNAPISRMGLSVFERLAKDLAALALGTNMPVVQPSDALLHLDGGRMYMDLSTVFWISSPQQLARKLALTDAATARSLEAIASASFRSATRPQWAAWSMLWRLPRTLWRLRRLYANLLRALFMPTRSATRFAVQRDAFEAQLRMRRNGGASLDDAWTELVRANLPPLFEQSMATLAAGVLGAQAFVGLCKRWTRSDRALTDVLMSGFDGNVVIDMHRLMHAVRSHLPTPYSADIGAAVEAAALPESARDAWQAFVTRYGCRGPQEMDIAQPRYADQPAIALAQIAALPLDPAQSPIRAAQRQIDRRQSRSAALIAQAGWLRARLLHHLLRVVNHYAGQRDTPKLQLLIMLQNMRARLLREGATLQQAGRLDRVEHVFDLSWKDLCEAARDPTLDLRERRAQHCAYTAQLPNLVHNFPALIDSRGRIYRAPTLPCGPGEFAGVGLSAGVARGPARTLRSPHDGPLQPGDVLIAYTTDPGWTPLFANAAAVVLEIGGALQHGAVVAREFGLPCVAGIADISTAIADGTLVEVDGAAGRIRVLGNDR